MTVALCGSLKRYLIFRSCVDQMKTPDFEAEARYMPLGERHKAVITPNRSREVYVADFAHVDLDIENNSDLLNQKA